MTVSVTYIQDVCFSADDIRAHTNALVCEEGVSSFNDLRVTESASAGTNFVDVAPGHVFIDDDQDSAAGEGGVYHLFSDDIVSIQIADNVSGSNRTDTIWAEVIDSQYSGVSAGDIIYTPGNSSEPAGGSYYKLATLVVPTGGTPTITGEPASFGLTDGNITDDRENYVSCGSGGELRETITFTVNDTFDKADYPWLKSIRVRLVGGGGGGGASAAAAAGQASAASGGAAGGYAERSLRVDELPASVAITIGQGGGGSVSSASPGTAGTATSFGALVAAGGGSGGLSSGAASAVPAVVSGVTGGVGTAGDVLIRGGASGQGFRLPGMTGGHIGTGGKGGDSLLGAGAAAPASNGAGNDATVNGYGGGGSGTGTNASQAANTGGDGANGVVIVDLFG